MAGRRDEYGNPIPEQQAGYGTVTGDQYRTGAGAGAGYGSGPGDYYGTNAPHETVLGAGGQRQPVRPEKQAEGHGLSGMLHRSGSSSSSSSEDDGLGGRRKKGMKEKIKEKLPGGHKDEGHGHATTGYGGTTATTGHGTATTGEYGGATTGYGTHDQPEKKGIMDKIKEKLPGSHH